MGRSHLCVHVVDGVYQVFNSEEGLPVVGFSVEGGPCGARESGAHCVTPLLSPDKASGQPKFSFMSLYEYYQHHKTINRMATHGPTKVCIPGLP